MSVVAKAPPAPAIATNGRERHGRSSVRSRLRSFDLMWMTRSNATRLARPVLLRCLLRWTTSHPPQRTHPTPQHVCRHVSRCRTCRDDRVHRMCGRRPIASRAHARCTGRRSPCGGVAIDRPSGGGSEEPFAGRACRGQVRGRATHPAGRRATAQDADTWRRRSPLAPTRPRRWRVRSARVDEGEIHAILGGWSSGSSSANSCGSPSRPRSTCRPRRWPSSPASRCGRPRSTCRCWYRKGCWS